MDAQPETTTPKRRGPNRETLKIAGLLGAIALIGVFTRTNGCDYRAIAEAVVHHPDLDGIKASLTQGQSGMQASLSSIQSLQREHAANTRALLEHAPTVVYRFNPAKEDDPNNGQLRVLRDAVEAGARVRVLHRPARGPGRVAVVDCVYVTVDPNGAILCTSAVSTAATDLPDGRRYQEVIRHDGTLTLSHWASDGTNVQGATMARERDTTWIVERPF